MIAVTNALGLSGFGAGLTKPKLVITHSSDPIHEVIEKLLDLTIRVGFLDRDKYVFLVKKMKFL